jgi:hypothetical protein
MATEAARLECEGIHRKERENRKKKHPYKTLTGLLMEGLGGFTPELAKGARTRAATRVTGSRGGSAGCGGPRPASSVDTQITI